MRVRFTPDVFRFQSHGGVSRYTMELTREMRRVGVDAAIVGGLHISEALAASGLARLAVDISRVRAGRTRQAVSEGVDLLVDLAMQSSMVRPDVMHLSWYPPGLHRLPTRAAVAVTVHDMISELYPTDAANSARTAAYKAAWVRRADCLFANSAHTRDDLVEVLAVDPERVIVAPLGVRPVEAAPQPKLARRLGNSTVVLYVGDRSSPYKRFEVLLRALEDSRSLAEVVLVCFGPAPLASELAALDDRRIGDRVVFASGDDARLAWLYERAAALAYPSAYEGFGLPLLEAMSHRCPVVASRVSSIPEVAGDAALLIDPGDAEALADALASVLGDSATAERLRGLGDVRWPRFTWASTCAATLEGYRRGGRGRGE